MPIITSPGLARRFGQIERIGALMPQRCLYARNTMDWMTNAAIPRAMFLKRSQDALSTLRREIKVFYRPVQDVEMKPHVKTPQIVVRKDIWVGKC